MKNKPLEKLLDKCIKKFKFKKGKIIFPDGKEGDLYYTEKHHSILQDIKDVCPLGKPKYEGIIKLRFKK